MFWEKNLVLMSKIVCDSEIFLPTEIFFSLHVLTSETFSTSRFESFDEWNICLSSRFHDWIIFYSRFTSEIFFTYRSDEIIFFRN